MKTTFVAVCAAALLLAGCQGNSEPSAPPTSQDALTTTDAAPTTASPPDDVSETSSAPAGDAETATAASGPPQMPDEAKEDSESGAEAFALHYLDVLNYAAMTPSAGHLEPLASDDCESCSGYESMIDTYIDSQERASGPIVEATKTRAAANALNTTVFLESVQTVPATLDSKGAVATPDGEPTAFTMVMKLSWVDGEWKVSGVQVQQ